MLHARIRRLIRPAKSTSGLRSLLLTLRNHSSITVRPTMSACRNTRRKRWSLQIRQIFFEALIFPVEGASLATYSPAFTLITRSIPGHTHPGNTILTCPEPCYLSSEWIRVNIVFRFQVSMILEPQCY